MSYDLYRKENNVEETGNTQTRYIYYFLCVSALLHIPTEKKVKFVTRRGLVYISVEHH